MPRTRISPAAVLVLLSALIPAAALHAQPATAVPTLDPTQLIGSYYTIARLPIHKQKNCLGSEIVLYALNDKPRSIKIVATCQEKNDNSDAWDSRGKFPSANGKARLHWFWPFTRAYWILGLAPDQSWVIAGTPNHNSLWLLSKTPTLDAATLAQLKSTAAAQGYNVAKLITIPQKPELAATVSAPEKSTP